MVKCFAQQFRLERQLLPLQLQLPRVPRDVEPGRGLVEKLRFSRRSVEAILPTVGREFRHPIAIEERRHHVVCQHLRLRMMRGRGSARGREDDDREPAGREVRHARVFLFCKILGGPAPPFAKSWEVERVCPRPSPEP